MKQTWQKLVKFRTDESGATAIEYGLIVTLLSVVIATAASQTGVSANGKMAVVFNAIK